MTTWVVIATGQSLMQEDVDYVRGKAKVCAVSNAFVLAPWADILVSHDGRWWMGYPESQQFKGPKFCRNTSAIRGVDQYRPEFPGAMNSGLYGLYVVRDRFLASRIILLGFDMHGTHFFGPHQRGLSNTTENRFEKHIAQFDHFKGCEVINCTPGSALKKFPSADLCATI